MKLKLKTDGLTGENLSFVEQLNKKFDEMPEGATKEEVGAQIQAALKAIGFEGEVTIVNDINSLKDELNAEKEGSLKNILGKQGIQINDILSKVTKQEHVGIFEQFKADLEEKKNELATIKLNKSGQIAFTLKAAAVTTTTSSITDSGTAASAQRLGEGPVYTIQRGKPFILEFVTVGNTTAPALVWFDETQQQGDFAITAEGAIKPLVQYKFTRKTTDYSKAAGRTTITEEFDMDYPRLVSTIKQLMEVDCRNSMNAVILTDMIANASAYAYNGLDAAIDTPDKYAAIGAAIAQLQSLYYTPNVLVLNPADAWAMRLEKGVDGHWIMPPFTWNGTTYEFGKIVVDPRVTAGNFFIGDGTIYNVDLKGDIIVRIGYASSTNDFESNQYTIIVEQYFFKHISTARKPGLIYANFATIQADIAAA